MEHHAAIFVGKRGARSKHGVRQNYLQHRGKNVTYIVIVSIQLLLIDAHLRLRREIDCERR